MMEVHTPARPAVRCVVVWRRPYVPVVEIAKADRELVAVSPHAELTDFGIGCWNRDLDPVRELLPVLDVAELPRKA